MAVKKAKATIQEIGSYDIVEKIADGGMGTVYKACHRETGETVAIKVIASDLACDADLLKRFEQEFEVCRSLDHPNVVRALEYGQDGEHNYLVMEYIDGKSLGERVEKKGKIAEAEAVKLAVQVAHALNRLHQRGFIHRDVKPDNILVTGQGVAKLTDLGIVKNTEADMGLTLAGVAMGTPHFMAPEQLADAKNVDLRCDVYGLGATLYMMLTAQLPFGARTYLGVFKTKASDQLKPAREIVRTLSLRTDVAIRKSMHSDPDQRHRSMPEFIEALTGKPAVDASVETTPERLEKTTPARATRQAERRAVIRYESKQEGFCHAVGAERRPRWQGLFHDISKSGLGLVLRRRFEPNAVLTVEIPGTEERRPARLLVRVVRVQRRPDGRWITGCKFAHPLTEEEVEALL